MLRSLRPRHWTNTKIRVAIFWTKPEKKNQTDSDRSFCRRLSVLWRPQTGSDICDALILFMAQIPSFGVRGLTARHFEADVQQTGRSHHQTLDPSLLDPNVRVCSVSLNGH